MAMSAAARRVVSECERDIRRCLTQLARMEKSKKERLSAIGAQQIRLWLWRALEIYRDEKRQADRS